MENTLYFKDMIHCDQNNYPKKVYKVEYSKMLIEILDTDHIQGRPFYFSSPHSRDDFIKQIKDHILRINHEELEDIQLYWKKSRSYYKEHLLFLVFYNSIDILTILLK